MTNVMLEILRLFFFSISSDVPAFKVHIFASDFKFLIVIIKEY